MDVVWLKLVLVVVCGTGKCVDVVELWLWVLLEESSGPPPRRRLNLFQVSDTSKRGNVLPTLLFALHPRHHVLETGEQKSVREKI